MEKTTCWARVSLAVLGILSFVLALVVVPFPVDAAHSKDSPVSSGGEGYYGDDWLDFGVNFYVNYRVNGQNETAQIFAVRIDTGNPNFNSAHSRTPDYLHEQLLDVAHIHTEKNYGDEDMPSAEEGDEYWDHYYSNYSPAIEKIEGCGDSGGTQSNCMSYAFDGYADVGTVLSYTIHPGTLEFYPIAVQLYPVYQYSWPDGFNTIAGDRCYTPSYHVWKVTSSPDGAAETIRWKNAESGIYEWDHPAFENNKCPLGNEDNPGTQFYSQNYYIWNKELR